MSLTFVLGAVGSGKTGYALREAQALAAETGGRKVVIATNEALDEEVSPRDARHQAVRGGDWTMIEAPLALEDAVRSLRPRDVAVIDGLTRWLSHLMARDAEVADRAEALVHAMDASPADHILLISNELDPGAAPDTAFARRLRDETGWMHQTIAGACDRVIVVQSGLAHSLKS